MSETEVKDQPGDEAPQEEAPPQDGGEQVEAQEETQGEVQPDPQPEGEAEAEVQADSEAKPEEEAQPEGEAEAEGEAPAEGDLPAEDEDEFYYDEAKVRAKQKAVRDAKLAALKTKRQEDSKGRAERVAALQEAIDAGKKVIQLTRCFGCTGHAWCTKHKEPNYAEHQALFEAAVTSELGPEWHVAVNCLHPTNKIGAFEVEWNGKMFFSKLERQIWPHHKTVVSKIKEASSGEAAE
jgi:hypothetical protein